MKRLLAAAFGLGLLASPVLASGAIIAMVDISDQNMVVAIDGKGVYKWPVSTARPGKRTPTGVYRPQFLSANHRSSLYNGAPMPWSIFFNGNYAIHGTNQVSRLGTPASAGCVRLHPEHARVLFRMVREAGMGNTHVVIRR
ncbi:MAG: L,D-transpeptidase [Rhodobacteraceae bacterium]|nr:L,D-transpeptidase [Paracoccaceae bacterium]